MAYQPIDTGFAPKPIPKPFNPGAGGLNNLVPFPKAPPAPVPIAPAPIPKPSLPGSFLPKLPGAGVLGGAGAGFVFELLFPDPLADGTLPKNPLAPISPAPNPFNPNDTGLGQQQCVDYAVVIDLYNLPNYVGTMPGALSIGLFQKPGDLSPTWNLVSSCPGVPPRGLSGAPIGQEQLWKPEFISIQTVDGSPDIGAPPTSTPEKMPDVPYFFDPFSTPEITELIPSTKPGGKLAPAPKTNLPAVIPKNKPDVPVFPVNPLPSTDFKPSTLDKIQTKDKPGELVKTKPKTPGDLVKNPPKTPSDLVKNPPKTMGDIIGTTPGGQIKIPDKPTLPPTGTTPPKLPPPTPPKSINLDLEKIKEILDKLVGDGKDCMDCEELKECLGLDNPSNNPDLEIVSLPYVKCTENSTTKEHLGEILIKQFYAVKEQFPPLEIKKFTDSANLAKIGCEDGCAIAAIPEWWQVRIGADRPQLVVLFGESLANGKTGRSRYPLTIPHYVKPESFSPTLPSYVKGQWEGILTLKDNSKVIVNAVSEAVAENIINSVKLLINPAMLDGSFIKIGQRKGQILKQILVKPCTAKFFATGQKDTNPDWTKTL